MRLFNHQKKDTELTEVEEVRNVYTREEFEIIGELTKGISLNLDLDKLLQDSTDVVLDKLKLHGCILFLQNDKGDAIYTKTISQSRQSRTALKMLNVGNFLDKLSVSTSVEENKVVDTLIHDRINISDKLTDFTVGVLNKNLVEVIQKATFTGSSITVPIKIDNKIIGVLLFTARKNNYKFTRELLILKTYADQVGVAIRNASLFKKNQKQLTQLEEQNHDLQSLYNLTSRISQSLDPDTVTQIAVDALPQDDLMIGAILGLLNDKKDRLDIKAVTQNRISMAAKKIVGNFTQYSLPLTGPDVSANITKQVLSQNRPYSTNDLKEIFSPPLPENLVKPVVAIMQVKSAVVFPLIIRGEAMGTVSYYLKTKDFSDLTDNQKQLFQTYTTQIAIALENASLYQRSQEVQQSLQNALRDLQEARRRERDMIDIMGHELRTPMSIVRNALSMMDMTLKSKGEIPLDKQKKYVDIGLESARRESNLIETLLSATKADSKGFQLTFEKVDLFDVIEDSLVGFVGTAKKKGLSIEFIQPEFKEALVYSDRTRVQEIVDNFVSNAVKYTQQGFVKIYLEDKGDKIWTIIEDSGMGIGPEDLKKLGRKFYRAQQHMANSGEQVNVIRPGGTGLGLYVSFALAKIMEGDYKVESTLGKGSKFMFGVPKYNGQQVKQVERKVQDFAVTASS